jgi:hypothetical protein
MQVAQQQVCVVGHAHMSWGSSYNPQEARVLSLDAGRHGRGELLAGGCAVRKHTTFLLLLNRTAAAAAAGAVGAGVYVSRYFGKEAAQIIIKLAAGNGFKKVYVGQDAIMATPAMSAFIRRRKLYGEQDDLAQAAEGHVGRACVSESC